VKYPVYASRRRRTHQHYFTRIYLERQHLLAPQCERSRITTPNLLYQTATIILVCRKLDECERWRLFRRHRAARLPRGKHIAAGLEILVKRVAAVGALLMQTTRILWLEPMAAVGTKPR
jgi:hypothetical protein